MATIKVKLRPSSVVGRTGTIFYQVTHRRATQQITTNIRLQPNEWDAMRESVAVSVADRSIIQNRIDSDTALLKRIIKDLDNSEVNYSVGDISSAINLPNVMFWCWISCRIKSDYCVMPIAWVLP